MSSGWIKIYRSLQEHWIWENEKYLKWWLDLLLLANHQDRDILINGELITIKRGQKHTSELWLSNRWNADRKQVRKFLELLKKNDMITITKSRQKGTTYEISNYNDFQGISEEIRTTKGTTIDTTEDTTKEHQMVQRKGHKQELKNLRIKELKKDINNNSDLNFKDFWEQNGFGMMLPVELEKLLAWVDDFAGNREIVMKALEVTSEQGANKRNYAYVNKILKNWESRGFKTIADVDAAEKQRQIELEQKYNKPTYNKYNKPVKEEVLPDWFDKEQKQTKQENSTTESSEDLEKKVAEIKAKLAARNEVQA
ncbi:TPA: DnaD domain-containing protein [Listeria monocytogenes]|uniref:DnaD-like helicase loader n=1 Tax=Listeria phage A118 TaxID=40521 RepID=UPI000009BA62|nr:DnaD domain-containing protein [Listeria monocytogenes]NP_463514.1 DnaD-like helicase loader [Listeria phage A118]YP_001468883.1 DnaD-like helicase loader [Listeria phage A006]AAY53279.1 gp43 [Listeria phage A006]EAG7877354.1 DnaD domain protein [Listeria monocytogenes]EAG7987624.1 DnaD domain protein [Listeria monocytogenes]EAG8114910.1 DnaD domain protein [Listeria monocytogenes]EAG8738467.1 DnaD domain protein [Listeria monocytogenes]